MLANAHRADAEPPRTFAAFAAEDHIAVIREVAEVLNLRNPRLVVGTVRDAVREFASRPTPDQLVVDISSISDALAAIGLLREVCDANTQVIALGDINDVDFYRKLVRSGVRDYLVKPVLTSAMRAALDVADGTGDCGTNAMGRLIAVVGTRGGVGATAIATNLAWTLANQQQTKVALVDLDLFFGSCALALDLEFGHGFREAMENPARIDSLFIEMSTVREGDNLYVLSAEEPLDATTSLDPASVELLLKHLRRDFGFVVVDFPRSAMRHGLQVLYQPASVVLVSNTSLAGTRDTLRLRRLVKTAAPDVGVVVCLNRVGIGGADELARADFEKRTELVVDVRIPEDSKAFAASAAAGKPILKVASRSKAADALWELAGRFGKVRPRREPFPMLKRLLALPR